MKKVEKKVVQCIWIEISFRFIIQKQISRWTRTGAEIWKFLLIKKNNLKQKKVHSTDPKYKQFLSGSIFLHFFSSLITFIDPYNNEMIIIYAFKTCTHFSWSCCILWVHIFFPHSVATFLLFHSLLVVHSVCWLHCV